MPKIEYGHPALPERFWAKVYPEPNTGCWIWGASTAHGYGYWDSRRVHRLTYELMSGPVPEGLVLDHLCRQRACANPEHLEAVSPRENLLRGEGFAARNSAKATCDTGHPLSGLNLYVTPDGRRQCRTCRAEASRAYRARSLAGEPVA